MKTTLNSEELRALYRDGFTLDYVIGHAQPFMGFYSAYSSIDGNTTMQAIYDFALGREQEAIEYIEKWYSR